MYLESNVGQRRYWTSVYSEVGDMLVVGGIGPRGSNRPPMGHLGGRGDSGHCSHPAITQTSAEDLASHDGNGGIMHQQIYLIWKKEHRP